MTGAQLANALNEAAIIAGRAGREAMARADLDEALLRQSVGSEQARRLNAKERRIVAYHEAGHAVCRRLLGLDPPEILSIVPRGPALGFVGHSPDEDSYLRSREELRKEIVTLLGGRAAEEEVFGTSFSGAVDDLARVHAVCRQMVGEFGMGIALDAEGAPPIALPTTDYALSDTTRRDVDLAAMMLARDAHRRARTLLAENRECLDDLAANALERETLSREDLDEIFAAHVLDETAAEVAEPSAGPSRRRTPRGSLPRTLTTATGEDHYFPPGRSVARMVHGERSVGLLYGQRALLIGALEPLTYTGTMLSTRAANKPFKRLARTAKIQETVFLGTRAEADEVLAGVHALHETIRGELPEAAGVHPAGTAYSAFDPELMLWTLAVIADSGRAMYEAMVRPLSEEERESLWQDYVLFGELFRLPRAEMPATYPEFAAWFEGRLASPDLQATEHALEMAPLVAFRQPVPADARGNLAIQNHFIKGTLPPRVREIFGIRWSGAHERSFRAMAAAHRRARRAFPYSIRRGRNDYFFDLVTHVEHQRGGTVTPELRAG